MVKRLTTSNMMIPKIDMATPNDGNKSRVELLREIVRPFRREVFEIKEAYELLMSLIPTAMHHFPENHARFNGIYSELVSLVDRNCAKIELSLSSHNIPSIFNLKYIPFLSLYSGELSLKTEPKLSSSILLKMTYFYQQISSIASELFGSDTLLTSYPTKVKDMSDYLDSLEFGTPDSTKDITTNTSIIPLKYGWKLVKDNKHAYLKYNDVTMYVFKTSNIKYRCFEYICVNQDRPVRFTELYSLIYGDYSESKSINDHHKNLKKNFSNWRSEIRKDKVQKKLLTAKDKKIFTKIWIEFNGTVTLKIHS